MEVCVEDIKCWLKPMEVIVNIWKFVWKLVDSVEVNGSQWQYIYICQQMRVGGNRWNWMV